jgi:hypothetical protein
VTVPDQPGVEIGRITGVTVAPEVSDGLLVDAVPLEVRTTVSGFVAEGSLLERPDITITSIRILSLDFATTGRGRATLDLARVWGPTRRGPIANADKVEVSLPDRAVRVVGLVGWPDHLEVRVQERSGRPEWLYSDQYRIAAGDVPLARGAVSGEYTASADGRLITVNFYECGVSDRCLPRGVSPATLIVEPQLVTVQGDWRWRVA